MKALKIVLGVCCIVMLMGTSQTFAKQEMYIGLSAGMVFPESLSIDDDSGANVNLDDVDMNKGTMNGLKIGWRPFENLSYELEYNYITNIDVSKSRIFSDPVLGSIYIDQGNNTINAFMFNLILRDPDVQITPYIGAGVGLAITRLEDVRLSKDIFITSQMSDSDTTIAGQFLMGIESKIDENWSATVGYKFFYTKPSFSDPDFEIDAKYKLHMLTAGLNYTF